MEQNACFPNESPVSRNSTQEEPPQGDRKQRGASCITREPPETYRNRMVKGTHTRSTKRCPGTSTLSAQCRRKQVVCFPFSTKAREKELLEVGVQHQKTQILPTCSHKGLFSWGQKCRLTREETVSSKQNWAPTNPFPPLSPKRGPLEKMLDIKDLQTFQHSDAVCSCRAALPMWGRPTVVRSVQPLLWFFGNFRSMLVKPK